MVRSVSTLIDNGGTHLSNVAGAFFGDRLLDQEPETQRRLRATAVALSLTSLVGVCFRPIRAGTKNRSSVLRRGRHEYTFEECVSTNV
jgi:hypothetical protein